MKLQSPLGPKIEPWLGRRQQPTAFCAVGFLGVLAGLAGDAGDQFAGVGVDDADLPDALGEGVLAGDRYGGAVDGDDGELAVRLERLALVDPDLDHRAERIKR